MLRHVVEVRHPRPRRQALLAPVAVGRELGGRVVAEARDQRRLGREAGVQERAVGEHRRVGAVVAEAARTVREVEAELGRRAGRERRLERVVVPAQRRHRLDEPRRHGERHARDARLARVVHVQVADRRVAAVGERQRPRDARALLVREDVGAHVDRRDLRLRCAVVRLEAPLVVGLQPLARGARAEVVDDVRVVGDPRARAGEHRGGRAGHRPRRPRHAGRCEPQPAAPAFVAPAHPQRMCRDEQQHGERAPVHAEPEHGGQEVPVPVQVRVHDGRNAAVAVQPVLVAQLRQED